MNVDLYNDIISDIDNYDGYVYNSKKLVPVLIEKYPSVSIGTLQSIVSNKCQQLSRRCNHKNPDIADRIYETYVTDREVYEELYTLEEMTLDRKKIVRIAEKFNFPCTLVTKIILSKHFETSDNDKVKKPTKKNISEWLSDSSKIPDVDLSVEVYWSNLYDDEYSPLADLVKQQVGEHYESILKKHCIESNMAFKDEKLLRKEGYDKTPDIKLEVPVLVNGVAIMWIESKALFANSDTHNIYVKEQLLSYWNRWGPGLIIYWFGFTEDIINPSEKRFIIMDRFPTVDSIVHLEHAKADQKTIEDMIRKLKQQSLCDTSN